MILAIAIIEVKTAWNMEETKAQILLQDLSISEVVFLLPNQSLKIYIKDLKKLYFDFTV